MNDLNEMRQQMALLHNKLQSEQIVNDKILSSVRKKVSLIRQRNNYSIMTMCLVVLLILTSVIQVMPGFKFEQYNIYEYIGLGFCLAELSVLILARILWMPKDLMCLQLEDATKRVRNLRLLHMINGIVMSLAICLLIVLFFVEMTSFVKELGVFWDDINKDEQYMQMPYYARIIGVVISLIFTTFLLMVSYAPFTVVLITAIVLMIRFRPETWRSNYKMCDEILQQMNQTEDCTPMQERAEAECNNTEDSAIAESAEANILMETVAQAAEETERVTISSLTQSVQERVYQFIIFVGILLGVQLTYIVNPLTFTSFMSLPSHLVVSLAVLSVWIFIFVMMRKMLKQVTIDTNAYNVKLLRTWNIVSIISIILILFGIMIYYPYAIVQSVEGFVQLISSKLSETTPSEKLNEVLNKEKIDSIVEQHWWLLGSGMMILYTMLSPLTWVVLIAGIVMLVKHRPHNRKSIFRLYRLLLKQLNGESPAEQVTNDTSEEKEP